MLFNSLSFAIFLPIVFTLYWLLPHKYRWMLILISSYYFYMSWNVKYVILILFTTVISYTAAILIEKSDNEKSKKMILAVAAISCLGVLFFFKYFNFVSSSVSDFLQLFAIKMNPITLKIMLPVGISFYTFQTLSYVIDVYKGAVVAEKHFGYYAAFISFFPQLVAGPIERTSNLLPQIKAKHEFDYDKASYGLKLMAWGFFKKLAIADVISRYVDMVYANIDIATGFDLFIGIFFFTIQIYCDFSGYSDIAIGTAKLLDIDLMRNFNSPYFSTSIKEFWSRWHISLSTWFRDYVYIPLGGNKCSRSRRNFNLLVTFLVSGLWHGANWTYVVWGGIHGLGQILEKSFIKKEKDCRIVKVLSWLIVFAFCNLAWVFFRAGTIEQALHYMHRFLISFSNPLSFRHTNIGLGYKQLRKILMSIAILGIFDFMSIKKDVIKIISKRPVIIRWIIYVILLYYIIIEMPLGTSSFIYFQF